MVQKHFQAHLSLGHSFHREMLTFHPSKAKPGPELPAKKIAISTLCCCRPSEEQPRGRDAQQFPKSLLSTIVSPLHTQDTVSSLQELCCLARGEFVLKKDILPFPGNTYSRETKPDAEEAWRELHNGGETSPFLPSMASCTLGIPTSLGAWDHNGKASQFFLNSFEKLFPFLSSIASSGNFAQDLNHSSLFLYHPYVGPTKTASQLTHPWSKAGGPPAQHQIVSSQFLFSPV